MSKRVQIDVPCPMKIDHGGTTWITMPGELLHDIAPHLAHVATFALHATPKSMFQEMAVSNVETGRVISHGRSPSAAISAARRYLAKLTPEFVAAVMNEVRPRDK